MKTIIKLVLFIVLIVIFESCNKDENTSLAEIINVTIANTENYKYDLFISN